MRKKINLLAVFLLPFFLQAQNAKPEMAEFFRSNGKIYVVVAIMSIIFLGVVFYLVHLDRKINKLKKSL
ncbi:CcmD family protein [Croceimicrobium sp.]|uniref:CcmD family protein n=1 Tax=Croceimicrobium sp. TaxID=2828340 RepID=UPI003BA9D90D